MYGFIGFARLDSASDINMNMLFTDFNNSDYFYEQYIPIADSQVCNMFWLRSEEYIRGAGGLEWRSSGYFDMLPDPYDENILKPYVAYTLEATEGSFNMDVYGKIWVSYSDSAADGQGGGQDGWQGGWHEGWQADKPANAQIVPQRYGQSYPPHTDANTMPAELNSPKAKQMVESATLRRLEIYDNICKYFNQTPGLIYYISDGMRWMSNTTQGETPGANGADGASATPSIGASVTPSIGAGATDDTGETPDANAVPGIDVNLFLSEPVYYISEPGKNIMRSHGYKNYNQYDEGVLQHLTRYIAFTSDVVAARNGEWAAVQRQLEIRIIIAGLPIIIALMLIIILLAGAGRIYGDEGGGIHFMPIDKPWLDIGLCAVAGFEASVLYAFSGMASVAWRYGNMRWMFTLCAALSVLLALPALGWLMSFIKHCKAGKWWRHMLVYVLIRGICGGIIRFAKSLWAGLPLTLQAVLISFALLVVTVTCSVSDSPELRLLISVAAAALALYGLLRYYRRLRLVELGAKAASGRGNNGNGYNGGNSGNGNNGGGNTRGGNSFGNSLNAAGQIAVTGGALGSIAASINSISDGIQVAVAEQMKSERLKTELITNISHDIRTPITSLITYADLLKTDGLDSGRAPEYLEILIQKSARLKTLTDDLFEASKAVSGNIDVHIDNVDLADLVRQVFGELDERVRASGLDFRMNLPEHAPIRADGKLLWRVMENLLSNVFKYALPGSRVYVDAVEDADGWYRLDIKNISERALNIDPAELTERFKRGDEARGGDGSGLGLSIAQSFVLLQGGRFALSIDGDLFKASLSLSAQPTLPAAPALPPSPPAAAPHALPPSPAP